MPPIEPTATRAIPLADDDRLRTPPLPSASVVMLRDGPSGLEVLLLRRHAKSEVLGGMYVFPGGKLDAADGATDWSGLIDQEAQALHERLGEPAVGRDMAVGLHVAALRETFEEAGVLLVEPLKKEAAPILTARLQAGMGWAEALRLGGLRWHTQALRPWSRWITPVRQAITTRRFDTRFFLARLPEGQQAMHDAHETTDSVWITPRQALQRYWNGDIGLVPPQLMGLAQLARHADVASAWQETADRLPPCILPETLDVDGEVVMCYPGDEAHPVRERALPGPTRLRHRHQRFEPFSGFDGWFS